MRITTALFLIIAYLMPFPALAHEPQTVVGQMAFERPNGAIHITTRVIPNKDVGDLCAKFMSDDWSGKTIAKMAEGGWVLKSITCG